jgi:hypothetical protein
MAVVGATFIGIATRLRQLDFIGKGRRPLVPGEKAPIMKRKRHRKRLGLPGFTKDGTIVIPG